MRTSLLVALSGFLALAVSGCIFPDEQVQDGSGPVIGLTQSSGCMVGDALQNRSLVDGNMIEAVARDTSVTVIHHQALYQCDAEILWELQVNGTELLLREVDKSDRVTNCMCPMDLSVTVDNLTPGLEYHIQIWDEFETRMYGEVRVVIGDCDAMCVTDEDCWNYPDMPRLDCEGNWACVNGQCNFYCDFIDKGCTSDAECPEGFQCVFYRADGVTTDPSAGDAAMPMYECAADSDCPEGMICELVDCVCEDGSDCDCYPWGFCTGQTWPTEGVCEPIVVNNECRTDEDCGSGYHCEFFYPMDANAATPGDPMPEEWCQCTEEYNPVCGIDFVTYSNHCFAECAGVEVMYEGECEWGQNIGYCVRDEDPGCLSDDECPDGYVCELTDWCAGTDPDGDGIIDPAWCMGTCVPAVTDKCEDLGGFCMPMDENGGCPEGHMWLPDSSDAMSVCGEGSVCCIPSGGECSSDADCYEMYGESLDPATGVVLGWSCVDGYCQQEHQDCGQFECFSDSDCDEGFICETSGYCDEAGYCCESTACVPANFLVPCAADDDCEKGFTCLDGLCIVIEEPPPSCQANADCAEGEVCQAGVCVARPVECVMDEAGMCICGGFAGFACPADMKCVFDDPNCSPDAGGADCLGHCY